MISAVALHNMLSFIAFLLLGVGGWVLLALNYEDSQEIVWRHHETFTEWLATCPARAAIAGIMTVMAMLCLVVH